MKINSLIGYGLVCCGLIFLGGISTAQDEIPISPIGRIYNGVGDVKQFLIQDGLTYLAAGNGGVQIWNFSDLEAPRFVGGYDGMKFPAIDLYLREEVLYVLHSSGSSPTEGFGIISLDVSDPTHPVLLGEFTEYLSLAFMARKWVIKGNHAYVAGSPNRLCSFNIGDPQDIRLTRVFDNNFADIVVHDQYLYGIETDRRFTAIEIDQDNELIRDPIPLFDLASTGYLVIDGQLLYIATNQDISIYNIDDPLHFRVLGRFNKNRVTQMLPAGNLLIVVGDYIYFVDISDIATPTELSYLGAMSVSDLILIENKLWFIRRGNSSLDILDISDPANVDHEFYYPFPSNTHTIKKVFCSGNYTYLADKSTLRVVDTTHPAFPTEIGFYLAPSEILDIVGDTSILYISLKDRGIRVLDLEDPSMPRATAYNNSLGRPGNLLLRDTLLYVATSDSGIQFLNVSDPYDPVKVGRFPAVGSAYYFAMQVDGDRIYCQLNRSISVLHFDGPTEITLDTTWDTRNQIEFIRVFDGIVYVKRTAEENQVIDMRNLRAPRLLDRFNPPGNTRDFYAKDSILYVADGIYGGLRLYSTTNLDSLVLLGSIDTPGEASDIEMKGNIAYVAGLTNLSLYRIGEESGIESPEPKTPEDFGMIEAYPNPFNSFTSIHYNLRTPGVVSLSIIDPLGRQVEQLRQFHHLPGRYSVSWQAENCGSGLYFVILQQGTRREIKPVILIR